MFLFVRPTYSPKTHISFGAKYFRKAHRMPPNAPHQKPIISTFNVKCHEQWNERIYYSCIEYKMRASYCIESCLNCWKIHILFFCCTANAVLKITAYSCSVGRRIANVNSMKIDYITVHRSNSRVWKLKILCCRCSRRCHHHHHHTAVSGENVPDVAKR